MNIFNTSLHLPLPLSASCGSHLGEKYVTVWQFNIYTSYKACKNNNNMICSLLPLEYMCCDWVSGACGRCVMCRAGALWSGSWLIFSLSLLFFCFAFWFPAQNWHCGCKSGGSVWFSGDRELCGRFWFAGSGGSACLSISEMPPPITHTLTPCKRSQCFLMAHNEIHLQGGLFTSLWNSSVYSQGSHSQYRRWCIYKPVHSQGCWRTQQVVLDVFLDVGILACHMLSCVPGWDGTVHFQPMSNCSCWRHV